MSVNLGYACINMTLQEQKISCNRGMIKRTFQAKGIKYASEIALSNVRALKKIIEWNNTNGIKVYRMTSCLFPWFSEYDIFTLPDIDAIADVMSEAGEIAMSGGQRLSFHPGPFNCLGSPKDEVVLKTVAELDAHSVQMDLMGLPQSPQAKIHITMSVVLMENMTKLLTGFAAIFPDFLQALSLDSRLRTTIENLCFLLRCCMTAYLLGLVSL